jgi:hypothetical protein
MTSCPPKHNLLLAVPNIRIRPAPVLPTPVRLGPVHLATGAEDRDVQASVTESNSNPGSRIHLSPIESTLVQEGVRRLKSQLLGFAGGSTTWRLFLGSGIAVLIGAVTLVVCGPMPQEPQITKTRTSLADETAASQSSPPPEIELTVSTSETHSGQVPAEYIDPFVPENQVQPKHMHALFSVDRENSSERSHIHQVSRRSDTSASPAQLTGTIETHDESAPTPTLNPLRKYERSRPRNR